MPSCCVAANCNNKKSGDILLHQFPKDPVQFAKWTEFVSQKRAEWSPNDRSVLCSEHFTEDCYDLSYDFKKDFGLAPIRKRLLKNAVPTVHKQMKIKTGPARYDSQPYRKRKRTEYLKKRGRKRCKSSERVKDPFFSENLLMNLRKVYKELILCDAELMCNDGVVLKAHWLILAFHSDYLRKLAVSLKSQNRMVKLDIESCVMETLLEYCYEGSFDVMRVSCEKLKAAVSFLQFKDILKFLETAVPACKNPPKQMTTSHHNIPSSVKKVQEKTLCSQIQTPLNTYKNAVCVTSKKQLPIVVSSSASAEPKPLPVTLHQETDPNQTQVPKEIRVYANQPSVSSVSTDMNSTTSQCHMSKTTNLVDQTATKIPFSQMNKNPPCYVEDVFKQKTEKKVGGKKRILLPKPDTQSLPLQPSTPAAPPAALVPLKVTQPSGKGVPLLMLTSPIGQVSLHQIRDTQSKGPIISNVVGSQVERWSNDTDADNISSVDVDHGQAKRRRASVVNDNATANELDMISPRSIYFDSRNNHYLKTRTRIEDTLSQEEDDKERLKIKLEAMDEYNDPVESGVSERTAFNGRRVEGEEFQAKEAIEESLGIKVESIDDPELEPYTVYVRSPGSVGGEAPGDQNSDCESLEQDLCDVGTVHVKTEFDMDSESETSNTGPRIIKKKY